jgi:hypothetical protein
MGPFEKFNESSGFIKGTEFLIQLNDSHLYKN